VELNTQDLGAVVGPGLWAQRVARGTSSLAPPPSAQPPPLAAVGLQAWFMAVAPAAKAGSTDGDTASVSGPYPSEYVNRRALSASWRPEPAIEAAFKPRQLSRWTGLRPPGETMPRPGLPASSGNALAPEGVEKGELKRGMGVADPGYLRRPSLVPSTQRLAAPRPVRQRPLPEDAVTEAGGARRAVSPVTVEVEETNGAVADPRAGVRDEYGQFEESLLRKQRLDMHR